MQLFALFDLLYEYMQRGPDKEEVRVRCVVTPGGAAEAAWHGGWQRLRRYRRQEERGSRAPYGTGQTRSAASGKTALTSKANAAGKGSPG